MSSQSCERSVTPCDGSVTAQKSIKPLSLKHLTHLTLSVLYISLSYIRRPSDCLPFDLANMSSLPKGQGVIQTLYRRLPIALSDLYIEASYSHVRHHVRNRNVTLSHLVNATPSLLPSLMLLVANFTLGRKNKHPEGREGGGRGFSFLWLK